ncbi:MAG: hypothetical protein R2831_09755 [Chitinophagaceae bacterium]
MKNVFLTFFIALSILKMPLYAQDFEIISSPLKPVHDKPINELSELEIIEDSMVYYSYHMFEGSIVEERVNANYAFINLMKKLLQTHNSYQAPLSKLKTAINILQAPDNSFKIYNWEINRTSVEKRYYGVIQLSDASYIPLVDVSDQIIRGAEDSVFTGTRWYGCIYYNIIQKEINGQALYFLLGWNGNSMNSEKKLMDVFGFNSQHQSQFGAPLFTTIEKGKSKTSNRFIIEYQKGAKIGFNEDKTTSAIVFDHCESQIGDPAKKYTYVPDGTYDGLYWTGQGWMMKENVINILELKDGDNIID